MKNFKNMSYAASPNELLLSIIKSMSGYYGYLNLLQFWILMKQLNKSDRKLFNHLFSRQQEGN